MLLRQRTKARAEDVLADGLRVGHDALLLHRVDRRDDGRRRERVTGIGEAAGEDPLVEGRGDLGRDHHAADGHVAGVRALREDDEVGLRRPVLEGEPLARAAEAGHDLVGDPDDPVLVAQGAKALEVAGRRDDHTRGADDRLEDDRADRAGTLELDDVLEVLQCPLRLLLR